jgi:phosphoribosyl 1,2-cyclic phosphodiesterase
LDAGLPCSLLRAKLASLGIEDGSLTAILLSHEHDDHVRGLSRLLRSHESPVVATAGTIRALEPGPGFLHRRIVPGCPIEIGDVCVTPLPVSHDAAEPVGFVVSDGESVAAVFTDLGTVDGHVYESLCGADLVVLEANYDSVLLELGPYPRPLKERIRSPTGHLSNEDCASTLSRLPLLRVKEIWLAHLSAENNTPQRALGAVTAVISARHHRPAVRVLPRRGAPVAWDSRGGSARAAQLPLL